MDINSIFAQPAPKVKEEVKGAIVEEESELPYNDPAKTEAENREREQRTVFVGNIPIECEKKSIIKLFKGAGDIEKVWVRSVPVDNESKISVKGKVILKQFVANASSKNCYILFSKEEEAQKAATMFNSAELKGRHLHVTLAKTIDKDYKTTVFVGNLVYETDEEDLRVIFSECGTVDYVRVIRDKFTHKCLGFAYVKLSDKLAMLNALNLNGREYKGRPIRVFKARKSNVNSREANPQDRHQHVDPKQAYAIRKGHNIPENTQTMPANANHKKNEGKHSGNRAAEKPVHQINFEGRSKAQHSNKKPFVNKPNQNSTKEEAGKHAGPHKGHSGHKKQNQSNVKPEGNSAPVPRQKKIKKPFNQSKPQVASVAKKAKASN